MNIYYLLWSLQSSSHLIIHSIFTKNIKGASFLLDFTVEEIEALTECGCCPKPHKQAAQDLSANLILSQNLSSYLNECGLFYVVFTSIVYFCLHENSLIDILEVWFLQKYR